MAPLTIPSANDDFYTYMGDDYLLALGQFITDFSEVERMLNFVVWKFARLDTHEGVAKAIFSSMRVDACTNHLNRITRARKLQGLEITELQVILDQLGKIARVRNDIVHLGISRHLSGRRYRIDNRQFAHVKDRLRETVVSPRILKAMSADLQNMFMRLVIHAPLRDVSTAEKRYYRRLYPLLTEAPTWRYKHRALSSHRQQPRAKTPTHRPRPQSFQG